ncbi:WAT1-related protein At5g64700-like isoform X2 [Cucumis melo]|uniref:WAT1-related protein n=1 Tax=Cucumis melo TaxID=3656 RepID=A0ABM3L4N9_CUCME|nr:WAT1-related protein At5g64700-like isoform X2 [Cucumis melo]
MNLFSKAAFASGINIYIFLFYRQALGTIVLLPLTIYFARKEMGSLSKGDVMKIFVQAILGFTVGLNVYGLGVKYTSATLGAAAFNCVPVTTFFFAFISSSCILQRPLFETTLQISPFPNSTISCFFQKRMDSWLFLALPYLPYMGFVAWVLRSCPSPLVLTFGQTFSSAIQSFFVAIAIERNPSEWKLAWNISLAAILYCGAFVIPVGNYLSSWVVKKKGPVFQAVTTPFNLIFTLIGSEFLLNDGIGLGSIIGAILLVLSLYSVLWGKKKEASCLDTKNNTNSVPTERKVLDNI